MMIIKILKPDLGHEYLSSQFRQLGEKKDNKVLDDSGAPQQNNIAK